MKALSVISIVRIVGFVSIALKYPCIKISEKTRICRKIASPKQLKPKLWITRLILWFSFGSRGALDRVHLWFFGLVAENV